MNCYQLENLDHFLSGIFMSVNMRNTLKIFIKKFVFLSKFLYIYIYELISNKNYKFLDCQKP